MIKGVKPFIVDIMSRPNFPVVTSFEMAGWNIFAVDWVWATDKSFQVG